MPSGVSKAPLVQIADPPLRPPVLGLLVQVSSGWRLIQEGVVLNGEWAQKPGQTENLGLGDESRVPWPQPVALHDRALGLGIEIPVHTVPRSMLVQAFDILGNDGIPASDPYFQVECFIDQFVNEQVPCVLKTIARGFVLELTDLQMHKSTHLSVNASWAVPPKGPRDETGTNWATWLFAAGA